MIIINAILVLGLLGFIFAGLLALAADYLRIEEDPRIAAITAVLPTNNCGACGAAGCLDFARRVVKGEAPVGGCVVGGERVAKKVAEIMGVQAPVMHRQVAAVHCGAKESQRKKSAQYNGVKTCRGADMVGSGGLACGYGCLGYGDCFWVCPYNAIVMKEGLPVIDADQCTACGKCIAACPRKIISLRPYDFSVVIACSSRNDGPQTRKNCPVGCIACKVCEKEVPDVFKISNNLAEIEYSKTGVSCEAAIQKCPTRCIVKL